MIRRSETRGERAVRTANRELKPFTPIVGESPQPHCARNRSADCPHWQYSNTRHPEVLAAQRRERTRIRSEHQRRWTTQTRRQLTLPAVARTPTPATYVVNALAS
jgi:hypothetical protein